LNTITAGKAAARDADSSSSDFPASWPFLYSAYFIGSKLTRKIVMVRIERACKSLLLNISAN